MDEPNKGGRPRKEFDLEIARNLVRIQCTATEIADFFGMTDDTLNARLKESGYKGFSDLYKSHGAEGKSSLRRAQWKAATENLNPTMLVWCGKQYLDQSDKNQIMGADNGPIQVEDVTNDAESFARRMASLAASSTATGDEEPDAGSQGDS